MYTLYIHSRRVRGSLGAIDLPLLSTLPFLYITKILTFN